MLCATPKVTKSTSVLTKLQYTLYLIPFPCKTMYLTTLFMLAKNSTSTFSIRSLHYGRQLIVHKQVRIVNWNYLSRIHETGIRNVTNGCRNFVREREFLRGYVIVGTRSALLYTYLYTYIHLCIYCNYILTVVSYGVLCANSCELSRIEFAQLSLSSSGVGGMQRRLLYDHRGVEHWMACDIQNLLAQPVSQSLQRLSVRETAGPRVKASLMYVLDLYEVLRCQTHIQAATTASCTARNTASAMITPATLTHRPCTQKRTRITTTFNNTSEPIGLMSSLANRHVVSTTLFDVFKYHGFIKHFQRINIEVKTCVTHIFVLFQTIHFTMENSMK